MKGRLSALAVAIVLVVGSFLVRREIIDDDNGDPSEQQADELVCITELADVCAAFAAGNDSVTVTVEDAGATLDRLAAIDSDTEPPLWLTVEPYPAMVDSIRAGTRAEPLGYSTNVLAASQLGVALPPDGRLDVLLAACDGQPLWRCIGTNAGAPWSELGGEARWGTVRPALGDVDGSALGLSSFASSVAGYFNDADVSRSRWENDPAFIPWLDGLADTSSGVSLSGGSALGNDGDSAERPRHRRHRRLRAGKRRCRLTTLRPQLSCSGDVVAGRAGRARRGCCGRSRRRTHRTAAHLRMGRRGDGDNSCAERFDDAGPARLLERRRMTHLDATLMNGAPE